MPFHHVAVATTDLDATRACYTEAMGFPLVKVDPRGTEGVARIDARAIPREHRHAVELGHAIACTIGGPL